MFALQYNKHNIKGNDKRPIINDSILPKIQNKIATPLPLNLAPNYNYTGCIMRGSWPNSMKTHSNEIKFNENTTT